MKDKTENCSDCDRPIIYGDDDQYHHLEEPERGCFLIRPEIDGEFQEGEWVSVPAGVTR
jgi:hypothetical protein